MVAVQHHTTRWQESEADLKPQFEENNAITLKLENPNYKKCNVNETWGCYKDECFRFFFALWPVVLHTKSHPFDTSYTEETNTFCTKKRLFFV